MKKYLFILISVSCFGQFNPVQWYLMTSNDTINTHIGNISGTINTRAGLATYLGINVGRIQKFTINGSDLDFSIIGSQKYTATGTEGSSIAYYIDSAGRVGNIGSGIFRTHSVLISECYFPGVLTQTSGALFQDSSFPVLLDMPNCTSTPNNFFGNCGISTPSVFNIPKCLNIGSTQGYDGGIRLNSNSAMFTIYANSALLTSNAGAVEGDLADAITRGVTVVWVTP